MFRLRFSEDRIADWAARYGDPGEDEIVRVLASRARSRGYLSRGEFLALCKWKTPRSEPKCASNSASRVRTATRLALGTCDERTKIGALRRLNGVGWPTASVILHFCDARPYPILDYRALWSLGWAKPPTYTFDVWWAYTVFTRDLARATGHSMRTIDRALWQYSKANQRRRSRRV